MTDLTLSFNLQRPMCNCRTGFTGDSCQLRHYDNDLMFVFEDDWKSKFEAIDQHILRHGLESLRKEIDRSEVPVTTAI